MAIGSDGEIGVTFRRWGEMTEEQRAEWSLHMRTWGGDLLSGYAKLCHPDPERVRFYAETTWCLV